MTFYSTPSEEESATPEEVLEFANDVRKALGGAPISALIPGTPKVASACVIAQSVNFGLMFHTDGHITSEQPEKLLRLEATLPEISQVEPVMDDLGAVRGYKARVPDRITNFARRFDDRCYKDLIDGPAF